MFVVQAFITAFFVLIGIYLIGPINPAHMQEKISAVAQDTEQMVANAKVPEILQTTQPTPAIIPPEVVTPVPSEADEKHTAYIKECVRYGYKKSRCENIWNGSPSDEQQLAAATPQVVFTHKHKDSLDQMVDKIQQERN